MILANKLGRKTESPFGASSLYSFILGCKVSISVHTNCPEKTPFAQQNVFSIVINQISFYPQHDAPAFQGCRAVLIGMAAQIFSGHRLTVNSCKVEGPGGMAEF